MATGSCISKHNNVVSIQNGLTSHEAAVDAPLRRVSKPILHWTHPERVGEQLSNCYYRSFGTVPNQYKRRARSRRNTFSQVGTCLPGSCFGRVCEG